MSEQGIVDGLDENLYHAHEALSQSQMKVLLENPARYRWQLDHPQPHRDVFDFGHAVHAKILGVGLEVATLDFDSWRTKAAQEAKAAARAEGKVPMLVADVAKVDAMAEAVLGQRAARAILENSGPVEQSMFWTDDATGVACRGRVDKIAHTRNGAALVDLKSCVDASPHGFAKSVWNFGYHMQRAVYVDGFGTITGSAPEFIFVCVEKEPPYPCAVYVLDEVAVSAGDRKHRSALEIYQECEASGEWPGYGDDISVLQSPRWAS